MFITSEVVQIVVICLITVFIIASYGTYRCKATKFVDPLTKSFFKEPFNQFLDGWGITHFLFFMSLAYMYPNNLLFIFTMGVLWEIIESIFHDHPFYISKCNYVLDTDHVSGWWYGRWQDIVMNSLGMILGYNLRRWK